MFYLVDDGFLIVVYFVFVFGKLLLLEGVFGVGKIEVVKVIGVVFGCNVICF